MKQRNNSKDQLTDKRNIQESFIKEISKKEELHKRRTKRKEKLQKNERKKYRKKKNRTSFRKT